MPDDEVYVRDKIAKTVVVTAPFPHIIIRDALPQHLYDAMAASLPDHSFGVREALRIALPREIERRLWPLPPAERFFYIGDEQAASRGLENLAAEWRHKFRPVCEVIASALHEKLGAPPHRAGHRTLFYRPTGWAVDPHVHHPSELLNALLYFPTPKNWPDQGTVLYRRRDAIAPGISEFDRRALEPAAIVPYIPNCLVAWLNGPNTIHGSNEIEGTPARRYLYMTSWHADGAV